MEVKNILVVMKVEEEHKKVICDVAPGCNVEFIEAGKVDEEKAKQADIIVGNLSPKLIKDSKNLKLMQLNSAGTDGYTADGVLPSQAVLCNATGSYGLAISEHMIGMLLCMMKKIDLYRLDQCEKKWSDHGGVKSVYGSKTLVIGYGDIGREFGIRMAALGSEVTGIRRNKAEKTPELKALYQMDKLYECMEEADIIATCLPGTPETYKIFNSEAFSHVKKGAYFINIGRGNAVDNDAIVEALESGTLAGAGLDVTDPEPLPADSKLWTAPNILITPHVSGGYHLKETHDRIIRIAAENIKHCINDEEYINVVDMKTGYRKFNG